MTEVEAVLGLLEAAGALSPGERRQLDEEAGGTKAELLLKLLLAKERDHFQDLRAALEKTQPHLLPILYLNGVVGPPQPAEGAAPLTLIVANAFLAVLLAGVVLADLVSREELLLLLDCHFLCPGVIVPEDLGLSPVCLLPSAGRD
ncbi:Disks large like protein 5 [Pteropus alecto]|uniref:Disks large like protein 5 n=1 Tax=Pteropus alecto TaxID=9402 RepID=L5KG88_PTEAL|nr:Disks large like protein 5 [Pteropus alecto]